MTSKSSALKVSAVLAFSICLILLPPAADAQRFVNNGNGTITDTSSGLMWAQNANLAGGPLNNSAAESFVASLNLYTDWRLPTRADFNSLLSGLSASCSLSLTSNGFTNIQLAQSYWTSEYYLIGGNARFYYLTWNTPQSCYVIGSDGLGSSLFCVWPVRTAATVTRIIRLSGSLAFGDVAVGSSAQRTLTIYNDGNAALTVSSISSPAGFSASWSGSIASGSSHDVVVTFTPTAGQSYTGNVVVNSDKTSGTSTLSASGNGIATPTRVIRLSGDFAFGAVAIGSPSQRTLTIYNDGNSVLTVSSITYPTAFSGALSGAIAPGASQAVPVTFAPTNVQPYSGSLTVASDATSGGNTAPVSGSGFIATRVIRLAGDLDFGDVLYGSVSSRIFTIHNDGNSSLTVTGIVYPARFNGSWLGAVAASAAQDVLVTFSPTNESTLAGNIVIWSDSTTGGTVIACAGRGKECAWLTGPNQMGVTVAGVTGTMYYLERSFSLDPPAWQRCAERVYGAGLTRDLSTSIETSEAAFYRLMYVPNADVTPPGLIAGLRTTSSSNGILLAWTNPPDPDFAGAFIMRKTTGYSVSASDGTIVYQGISTSAVDVDLAGGVDTNYYCAFAYDTSSNFAAGSFALYIRPRVVTIIAPVNGTILPAESFVTTNGASVTFTAMPGAGYMVDRWYLDAVAQSATGTTFVLSNIQANRSIEVRFKVLPRFTVVGSYVLDNTTGLKWKKDANLFGDQTYAQAVNDCAGLGYRLPTKDELLTLVPLPSGHPFINVRMGAPTYPAYWSSTANGSQIWCVHMDSGTLLSRITGADSPVWPVQ